MRNHKARPTLHQFRHCLLNLQLCSGIHTTRCFIENEYLWISQKRTSNGEQLLLTLRDVGRLFVQHRTIALWQGANKVVSVCRFSCSFDLAFASSFATIGDIIIYSAVKEPGIL